jgi:hypothetical protein
LGESRVDASNLGVGVRQGIVTLTGHLNSPTEKLAARRAILRIAGVKGVALDVEVELPEAQRRSDSEIASAASIALRWHLSVPRNAVKLSVDDGVITLTGEVAAPYQPEASEKAVGTAVAKADGKLFFHSYLPKRYFARAGASCPKIAGPPLTAASSDCARYARAGTVGSTASLATAQIGGDAHAPG